MQLFHRSMKGAVAAVLVASAIAIPVAAFAAPASALAATNTTPGRAVITYYRELANARRAGFTAKATLLSRRLDRLSVVADVVAHAGGDVVAARTNIVSARGHLASARALAVMAYAELRTVPWATDRGAALAKANADWKLADGQLQAARADKKVVASDLLALVRSLHLTAKVKSSDFL